MHSLLQRRRIKRGVAFLDKEHGSDWVEKVDPDRLDISRYGHCVLGQLHGSYEDGLFDTGLVINSKAEKYGFYDKRNRYDSLTKLWVKQIKKEQLARSA